MTTLKRSVNATSTRPVRDGNSRKNTPGHVFAVVVLGNVIRGKDAGEQLEKGRVEVQEREEEEDGDDDIEQVSECWVAGGDADKETAEWVRDEQAEDELGGG
jgi:hypothetical protein